MLWAKSGEGEKIFKTTCMACHTIGKGRLVGPDLKNVHKKRTNTWMKEFIMSSTSMIKRGDKEAVTIFNEYSKMPMPDHALSDGQFLSLVEYIKKQSLVSVIEKKKKVKTAVSVVKSVKKKLQTSVKITHDDLVLGQALFTGRKRFEKKGAACTSCHNVNIPGVISGGSLAVDLTQVYSRMGDAGVGAVIKSSPFPAMRRAYEDRELNEDEIFALQAFLRNANNKYAQLAPAGYLHKLLGAGAAGVFLLFGLFSLVWGKRKRGSVNQDIYDRQLRSE